MSVNINNYIPMVGQRAIDELHMLAGKLEGRRVQNINSTSVGGGVAELLTRITPLLKQLGVNAGWDVIKGDEKFFGITKRIHNALHGGDDDISREDLAYFLDVNRENAKDIDFYGDMIVIHDPQPIALVERKKELGRKWIWRGHVDFSDPRKDIMDFLKSYIENYECAIFSAPAFAQRMPTRQVLMAPSIDPLSDKNKELSADTIQAILSRFGIDSSRPIVTQIGRFDYLKDPLGVIEVYRKIKKHNDCQLVIAGGGATDDPEGMKVLDEVRARAGNDRNIHIIFLPPSSDIEVNALQRASTVVLQKSLREGFGLTVSEALWKAKPVIASAVGGIPLQIVHKQSGILTHSIDGTAYYLKQLLNDPRFAKELGDNGREHVKHNFLITRNVRDYLLIFLSMVYKEEINFL
jgi:trehalose synthase